MYGDEELGLLPNKLYTKPYAEKALELANYVYRVVTKLLDELVRKDI